MNLFLGQFGAEIKPNINDLDKPEPEMDGSAETASRDGITPSLLPKQV